MAQALFSGRNKDDVVKSAGTHVNEKAGQGLHEHVLEVMREAGYELSCQKRVQLTPEMVNESDKIIVMLDDHADLPDYVPMKKVEFWDVPDAKDQSLEFHRMVRDKIAGLVRILL